MATLGVTPSTMSMAARVARSSVERPDFRSLPVTVTVSVPAPMALKELDREPEKPLTVVIRAMTAATPISMPSTVRNERTRLPRMLESDIFTHSPSMMNVERNESSICRAASLHVGRPLALRAGRGYAGRCPSEPAAASRRHER